MEFKNLAETSHLEELNEVKRFLERAHVDIYREVRVMPTAGRPYRACIAQIASQLFQFDVLEFMLDLNLALNDSLTLATLLGKASLQAEDMEGEIFMFDSETFDATWLTPGRELAQRIELDG